jgi:hypothetical protein
MFDPFNSVSLILTTAWTMVVGVVAYRLAAVFTSRFRVQFAVSVGVLVTSYIALAAEPAAPATAGVLVAAIVLNAFVVGVARRVFAPVSVPPPR